VRRRTLLAGALAGITIAIVPLRKRLAQAQSAAPAARMEWGTVPGRARWRIDGVAKARGEKLFARDLRPADIAGWPKTCLHAKMVGATRTDRPFLGVDAGRLVPNLPDAIILGPGAHTGPDRIGQRDVEVDDEEARLKASAISTWATDRLDRLVWPVKSEGEDPLIVPPGELPNFFGQPLAFLLFKSPAALRRAADALRFDQAFIRYYDDGKSTPPREKYLIPETRYVRAVDPRTGKDMFSFTQDGGEKDYENRQAEIAGQIESDLAKLSETTAVSARLTTSFQDPMFMEPESGLGWFDPDSGVLRLVLGSQSPDHDAEAIRTMLCGYDQASWHGCKLHSIEIISCLLGGGFGGRDQSPFSLYLALVAMLAKRPLRLAWDRFDQFQAGLKRQASTVEGTLTLAPDGTIAGLKADLTYEAGGRGNLSPYVAALGALAAGGAYNVPRADIKARARSSGEVQAGSQRGFGGPEGFLLIETLIDAAAVKLGRDPIELRRLSLLGRGGRTVVGAPLIERLRLDEILDRAAAHPLWTGRQSPTGVAADRRYGVGFALSLESYGTSGDAVLAEVGIDATGDVSIRSNAVDMGNGSGTTFGIVVADWLGTNAARVELGNASLWPTLGLTTDKNKSWGNPSYVRKATSSSSSCLTAFYQAHAVRVASRVLFETGVLAAARKLWGARFYPTVARWEVGRLVHPGFKPLPREDIASAMHASGAVTSALVHAFHQAGWVEADYQVDGVMHRWPITGLVLGRQGKLPSSPVERQNCQPPPKGSERYARTTFAPCANLVAVSVGTAGDVRVERVVTIINAGPVMTPAIVTGQSHGGAALAIGYTLFEDAAPGPDGPGSGQWNLHRYRAPLARDLPWATHELICLDPLRGETSKGIAEALMCAIPAAIVNALAAATGTRFYNLPVTPDAIQKALNL
jgi:CO/xanthine dehydrogenase Mo-binding subunit